MEMKYYEGELTFTNGEHIHAEFNFINILSGDFICIKKGNYFEYIKMDNICSICLNEPLEIEIIEEE